jgi:hypothetical protein
MTKKIEFMGYTLTDDECEALHGCLIEIREKKRHDQLIQACKTNISFQINGAIALIGLAETKRLVRELNRELRGYED